ncbi:hypothetical protein ACSBR2_012474 [Camellia fascicularis]
MNSQGTFFREVTESVCEIRDSFSDESENEKLSRWDGCSSDDESESGKLLRWDGCSSEDGVFDQKSLWHLNDRLDIGNKTHVFGAENLSHPKQKEIYEKLGSLLDQIKRVGNVVFTNSIPLDMDNNTKEKVHHHHSKRIAIAFALISMPVGKPDHCEEKFVGICGLPFCNQVYVGGC